MQMTQTDAEKRLSEMHMSDMPGMEFARAGAHVDSDWFVKYKKLCHEFMMSLTDSVEGLVMLNLTQDEFMALIMGRAVPANTSFRLRVPLTWGGKLDISNMFMCRTFPTSMRLDEFIIEQSGARTVWLPNPAGKVYVPQHNISGGDGGNATSDRLSQIAAQIVAARGMGQ